MAGQRLTYIRLDDAGENRSAEVQDFPMQYRIRMELFPAYGPQIDGTAEMFMQEVRTRTRVLLQSARLPQHLWAEAKHHAN